MLTKRLTVRVMTLVFVAGVASLARAQDSTRDVIFEWNRLLQNTIPATAALQSPRYYSMLHVAMFDAVNSIERRYTPYHVEVDASSGASAEAAAAQAGHDILTALFAGSAATYDAALAARLENIPVGTRMQGVYVGARAAGAILAWRDHDGWEVPPPPYVLPPLPGLWQPTPPGFAAAAFTQFPGVKPFGVLSPTQFLPRRQPELTSAEYARDFNEVKVLGRVDSTVRTADQTRLARLFAGTITRTTLFAMWNNVARDASVYHGLDLVQTARLFALVNVGINDGLQTTHSSKFTYGLWRPVTAIQRADEDLNPLTEKDAAWLPLITTPAYPSHAGNMACVGASAARALQLGVDSDDMPIAVLWQGNATSPTDVTINYTSFSAIALDQALARIYSGIHYWFEQSASREACPKVVNFIEGHYMLPR